jgi:hypothetical protein
VSGRTASLCPHSPPQFCMLGYRWPMITNSANRCRAQRIKCDNNVPCASCRNKGRQCSNRASGDARTLPQAYRYVTLDDSSGRRKVPIHRLARLRDCARRSDSLRPNWTMNNVVVKPPFRPLPSQPRTHHPQATVVGEPNQNDTGMVCTPSPLFHSREPGTGRSPYSTSSVA